MPARLAARGLTVYFKTPASAAIAATAPTQKTKDHLIRSDFARPTSASTFRFQAGKAELHLMAQRGDVPTPIVDIFDPAHEILRGLVSECLMQPLRQVR